MDKWQKKIINYLLEPETIILSDWLVDEVSYVYYERVKVVKRESYDSMYDTYDIKFLIYSRDVFEDDPTWTYLFSIDTYDYKYNELFKLIEDVRKKKLSRIIDMWR